MSDFEKQMINAVLQELRKAAELGNIAMVDSFPRKKNRDTLFKLQYKYKDVINEFCSLTTDNFYSGPIQDKDSDSGMLWVFKKHIDSLLIYMKVLQIPQQEGDYYFFIISFHEDERTI